MADSLAVLSGSTCACNVPCGITPWYRFKFEWDRGDLVPYSQIGTTSEQVGSSFNTSISTKTGFTGSWQDTNYDCCPGIFTTDAEAASFDVYSFSKGSRGTSSTYMRYAYGGLNSTSGSSATFDVNVAKYKTDKPAETTLSVRSYLNTWYYSIGSYNSGNMINANVSTFLNYARAYWWTEQYCWWDCEWLDYHQYTVVRGGLAAQNNYGLTSFNSSQVLGSATAANLYVRAAMYDKDPNTTGANIIAGNFSQNKIGTVSVWSNFSNYVNSVINLETLGFTATTV
jgi:hypothetical protein